MQSRDPFPRRTATPARLVPWLFEVGRTFPGLVRSYLPGQTLDPRTRERVTEVNGCRYCAWIHGSWQDFLGEKGLADADEALLTYARACAEAGTPLDPAPLARSLPPEAVQAVRATVAQIEVSNLVGNTVDGLLARVTRKRPLDPVLTVQELAVVGAALPLAVPLLAAGAALRTASRLAPPVPQAQMPPGGEANLLVHLLAQAAPTRPQSGTHERHRAGRSGPDRPRQRHRPRRDHGRRGRRRAPAAPRVRRCPPRGEEPAHP